MISRFTSLVLAALRDVDKKVVEAFVARISASGNVLSTDGHSLEKFGLGAEKVAVWRGSKIAIVSTESARSDEVILRYLVKVAGKSNVTWPYDRPGFEKSIRFETGGDALYRNQYDGWIVAYVPGLEEPVGRLDWSEYDNHYTIKMVEVDPEFRRSGIATEMYRKLFKDQGITKKDLAPTMRTPEGQAFRERTVLAERVADRFLEAVEEAQERRRFDAMTPVGQVAVDSGTLLVIDPAYIEHWASGEHPELSHEGYLAALEEGRNQLNFANGGTAAVILKGFGGDGTYPVFVEPRTEGAPVGSFAVDFLRTASEQSAMSIRVAARYKSKKKVKTESGEMTVYEYSDRQIANRNRKKAERIEKLRKSIGKLRAKVKRDLHSQDPEKTLVALAVALMDHTYERVGNDESAKDGHVGVTGWCKKHVSLGEGSATIKYVGKSGVKHEKKIDDPAIRTALKDAYEAVEGDNDEILSWEGGRVTAQKVNDYLSNFDITAKDLRGFHANREVQERLREARKKGGKLPEDKKKRAKKLKDEFLAALDEAADAVGHEPSTLRSQYLVPSLEERYLEDGSVLDKLD